MNVVEFSLVVGKLKHLKRTGWVKKGVNQPESVAGHMYRMGLLTMTLDPALGLDRDKCTRMALVHDLAEAIVGDITPYCGVTQEDKFKRERDGLAQITSLIPGFAKQEFTELWQEYEKGETPEARMVKDLDKFDMISQAFEYEQSENRNGFLEEFFTSTEDYFKTDTVKEWVKQLKLKRAQMI